MPLPVPVSTVDIDPNYEAQLRALQTQSTTQATALRSGGQVQWTRPATWTGNPNDFAAIHTTFNRDVANQQFVNAVKDAQHPGVTGDLVAATLMIDYLGVLERSFKQRMTMGRIRRNALVSGRKAGHGSPTGVFIQSGLEYLRRIVKRAKGNQ
jgi:hypothetical protein